MARDVMYYFDKNSPYARHELGEIQTNFNLGLGIDGSKDSMQIQVFGFESEAIKPNTILYHSATNLWFVVARDIVKRNASEEDYYYTHNITINGAIELLNVRDYTDSGYNDKTYTIDKFIKRLFKLSTFEFPITIDYGNNVDENKMVDYIKSFENYTLLSALREFLNGYNCEAKLSFQTSGVDNHIVGAILKIIPRTGNIDLPTIDISVFDDIRETKTHNKESYGTTVVSNAQNVTSTLAKTYPQTGGVGLTADRYEINNMEYGYIKLPTPIFKINWVKAISPVKIYATFAGGHGFYSERIFPQNNATFMKNIQAMCEDIFPVEVREQATAIVMENITEIRNKAIGTSQITFYDGFEYNPHLKRFYKNESTPYMALAFPDLLDPNAYIQATVITDKQTHETFYDADSNGLYYERGSNKIEGFKTFQSAANTTAIKYTDNVLFGYSTNKFQKMIYWGNNSGLFEIEFFYDRQSGEAPIYNHVGLKSTVFQVNYIPMADLKIKHDNARNDKDIKLYNQNGKLNDGIALAKLVDSYSKEIESDNITRYMHYTDFSAIPQVGQLVNNNGEIYVINNISYDFFANEQISENELGYYIECEFTLSKYISVKSLMTNPNSNIRDYGIPQKYNVKRRQTYRDYFEFSLTEDELSNIDTPYVALDNYVQLGIGVVPKEYDHTAIIKVDYDEPVDNHDSWYYQLNTIAFIMNKSIYEIVDFNDNNIIGYDMQNTKSGFDMSNIWKQEYKNINTPVSYVDDKGKAKGITLQMLNRVNIDTLYENVSFNSNMPEDYELSSHCFIGSEFYYGKYEGTPTTQNVFFNGSGNITYENNETKVRIALTDLLESTEREDIDYSSVVVNSFLTSSCYWFMPIQEELLPQRISMTISSYQIVKDNGAYYLEITDNTGDYSNANSYSVVPNVTFTYDYHQVYQGAIELKDYEIKELDYDKDAIEVPVFEYILQLGDTEEVEVGDKILTNENGKLFMYGTYFADTKVTQLNAKKFIRPVYATSFAITGNDDYSWGYRLVTAYTPVITYEDNNTKMRIKFYNAQRALFYGDADQERIDFQEMEVPTPTEPQMSKNFLLGKDVVIWRHNIKNMNRDIDTEETSVDYDSDVMFIIHNPTEDNFDGDDLIVNINHYKLK